MGEETNSLRKIEETLRDIAVKSRIGVEAIVNMVNENEDVLNQMKANLRENFVQAMIKVVVRSDNDGDMKIDQRESHILSLRLKIMLEPYGITLDTRMFEDMIREDNDVSNILSFCGTLLFQDEESGSDDSVGSANSDEDAIDFESFCKTLGTDEEPPMTYEEKCSMITFNDKYSKGSVEVARGGRMSMVPTKGANESRRKTLMKEVKKRQTVMVKKRQTEMAAGSRS